VGDTPIYDVIVAEDGSPDTVPVSRLAKHLTKLPKSIAPADITDLMSRLRALDATRPQLPVPKGPMPGSLKQARSQARQSMRGR
ncbi:MAG TPA: DUF4191 family protein, partial [Nocardioidaceae bacterium]|nr:DUF4191 family protein [Nocardioidaceae bacterium]